MMFNNDGTKIVIGAPELRSQLVPSKPIGAVYVFELDQGSWVQIGSTLIGSELDLYDGSIYHGRFGRHVSINDNGDVIAIGSLAGQAEVYNYINDDWEKDIDIQIPRTPGLDLCPILDSSGTLLSLGKLVTTFSVPSTLVPSSKIINFYQRS